MKKLIVMLGIIFTITGLSYAEELRSQFRVWKSTFLDGANYTDIMFTSAPIIVHGVRIASATINTGINSYLAMYNSNSSSSPLFTFTSFSTRIFCVLEQGSSFQARDHDYDIKFSSITFYSKQGAGKIQILWDWFNNSNPLVGSTHVGD